MNNENTSRTFMLSSNRNLNRYPEKISLEGAICCQDIIVRYCNKVHLKLLSNSTPENQNQFHNIKNNLHIHDFTFLDIINSNPNKIFYICDHCLINENV